MHAVCVCHVCVGQSDLQHRVGHQHPVSDPVQEGGAGAADGVVLQDLLGGLRLPGAALSGDEDEVVVELRQHGVVGVVGQGVAGETRSGRESDPGWIRLD